MKTRDELKMGNEAARSCPALAWHATFDDTSPFFKAWPSANKSAKKHG
jgi:hypothetical protein